MALLEGCSVEDVRLAVTDIEDAIKVGAPLYNKGDAQGCYDLYEKTSLRLVNALKACPGVREALLAGVSAANRATDPRDKAWAVRHAFDRVLGAVTSALEEGAKQNQPNQNQEKQKP